MKRNESGHAVQIIDIKKDLDSKYVFILKEEKLKKILNQVDNCEVHICSIAGM